ncbi:MAG: hypothetical protein RQ824_08020 [bacterium]|nr:hypothetical protein [bacterium]
MARVKGGLGESSLIEDLTKPISFHISESLEPPPEFNRRKPAPKETSGETPGEAISEEKPLPQLILEKTASMTEGEGLQIVFHLDCSRDSLLLESAANSPGSGWRITSVSGKEGVYRKIAWKDSAFSAFEAEDVIDRQTAAICLVEVVSDESFLNFSSLDDFFEWLEI